ncbi:MAG: DNA translocase FtsK [Bacilli bacterium]|jgi:S-DNA-T family DNA segregation ATPase FtsK/SpoIIIE
MAKKKERREETKKPVYHIELTGLLLILIAIIGLGAFGPAGNIVSGFAIFIGGSWYFMILIYLFCVGFYMILNRERPNFFSPRLVGLYVFFATLLITSHITYIKELKGLIEVLRETSNQVLLTFKDVSHSIDAGGGFVGAFLAYFFVKFFDKGVYIVLGVLLLFSFIMLFDISIGEMIDWIRKRIKKIFKRKKVEEKKEDQVIISNLTKVKQVADQEISDNLEKEVHYEDYVLPSMMLLENAKKDYSNDNQGIVRGNIKILERVLTDFDIEGKIVQVHIGPSVTQYELEIKAGTKVNKILGINREIALALAAKVVRIQAPIPGKGTIGIEIPNKVNTLVSLREVLSSIPDNMREKKLLVGLGIDIMGKPIYAEIDKTPHLLIAGATGSGKSVCINTMIISLLMRTKPDEVKLVLVDPKKVELNIYNGIPHLLAPVVTDPRKASVVLMKIVSEMERRYDLFDDTETKGIDSYNLYLENKNKKLNEGERISKLPYLVVIIDELADLMLVASKEVEDSIMRLTQMARAAGIHLIVATQRPSTDVITGLIKANIPSRIAFSVSSNVDSRTILDMAGAEKLLGQGDMLFLPTGENIPLRLQGSYVNEKEIKRIIDWVIRQQKAKYDEKLVTTDQASFSLDSKEEDDELYQEVLEFAIQNKSISTSLIQRKYRIGYNRAARIIDLLEERGIVGPPRGSKAREVLKSQEEEGEE